VAIKVLPVGQRIGGKMTIPGAGPQDYGLEVKVMAEKDRFRFGVVLLSILFPLEITASVVATETLGTVTGCFLLLGCIAFNMFACFYSCMWFWKGMIGILSFGLLIIWHQVTLAFKMDRITLEAANVVTWAYSERVKTGAYPEALDRYVFLYPHYKDDVNYYKRSDESFDVTYQIGSDSTYHWYKSSISMWGYADD
jgi:hypothetical protein